jgi:membrane-associated phospholipid phosphatase
VGRDRVVGGVHHPLDVMAGKVLGELVFNALIKEERFLNDLESFK